MVDIGSTTNMSASVAPLHQHQKKAWTSETPSLTIFMISSLSLICKKSLALLSVCFLLGDVFLLFILVECPARWRLSFICMLSCFALSNFVPSAFQLCKSNPRLTIFSNFVYEKHHDALPHFPNCCLSEQHLGSHSSQSLSRYMSSEGISGKAFSDFRHVQTIYMFHCSKHLQSMTNCAMNASYQGAKTRSPPTKTFP